MDRGVIIPDEGPSPIEFPEPPVLRGRTLRRPGVKPVVFAGHGFFAGVTDRDTPKVRLPPNVSMVFWCHHGEALINVIANFIEARRPLSGLPNHLAKVALKGKVDPRSLPEVIEPGGEVWNYRLIYPRDLSLAVAPTRLTQPAVGPVMDAGAHQFVTLPGAIRDPTYCVVAPWSRNLIGGSMPLLAMIQANMSVCAGNTVHWCACRTVIAK